MARVSLNSLLYLRRAYNIAAENAKLQSPASLQRKMADSGKDCQIKEIRKEVFWMKHPKTGNWIPEDHFEEVDIAELRHKLLPQNRNM